MSSGTSYLNHGGNKRKHADHDSSGNHTEDQGDTSTAKRQKLNSYYLDLLNQDPKTFSAGTCLSFPQTFSAGTCLSFPQTFSAGTTYLETLPNTLVSGPVDNEWCRVSQWRCHPLSDEDAYWHLADQYYEAPSEEDDVSVNDDIDESDDDDDIDESDEEDDIDESDDDDDKSDSGYEGDDDLDDTDEENTDDEVGTDDSNEDDDTDDEDEYEIDEEMTEEDIGLLLNEHFHDSYVFPYDAEE